MSRGKDPIYIVDLIGRLRIRKLDYAILLILTVIVSIILGLVKGIVDLLTAPYSRRNRIKNWLNSDPDLIEGYEFEKGNWGHFTLRIDTRRGPKITVHTLNREVIRVYAVQDIDPGAKAVIEQRGDLRNHLLGLVEAVFSNMRGSYTYLDQQREPCGIDSLESIAIEHRFYSDGFSQQEFMNTILDFNRAMSFVNRRAEQMADNLRDDA